jgi:hypothetical protein
LVDQFDEVAQWIGVRNSQGEIVAASRLIGQRKSDGKSRAELTFAKVEQRFSSKGLAFRKYWDTFCIFG